MKGGIYSASAGTLSSILADITTILTSALSWMSSLVDAIVSNPIILLFVVAGFAFFSVRLIKRLMGV